VARLFSDENVPIAVVEALRSRGHDVVTLVGSLLGSGVSDADILALARAEERAVVTLNRRDFSGCTVSNRITPESSRAPLTRTLQARQVGSTQPCQPMGFYEESCCA
jgi:hypothetical protein